jgi:acyl transferase domain-containing protein/acyl carrier protein/NAD(P)-dependent dehydrogenase (short-subunit alcohol dehydrogenase family)
LKPESSCLSTPLAIIGIGCIFPRAVNLREYWHNIKKGIDAITDIPETHWSLDDYFDADQKTPDMTYGKRGGFLSPVDFDPMEFAIAPNSLEAIDTSQLLGLMAAKRALEDAGYGNGREFNRKKTSIILGVTGTLELVVPLGARLGHPIWRRALKEAGADESLTDKVVEKISESYVDWQENSFPGLLGNVVAGRIANYLDLGGTNCVVDAACASSLSALHLAHLELASGKSEMIVTGGVDTFNDIFMFMCFSKTPALSPTGDVRPFSENCDGTILGEGLGMIVIKRLSDAERDGDRIYAVIRGIGTSSDGKGAAVFAPQSDGQVRAMLEAYECSGISPRTVELVEAHGTGTKVGDATEITSLTRVYGEASDDKGWCALGSVKSQIGHTKAAAGVAGLIKTALSLYHGVLPPTIKVEKPMEGLAAMETPFYLNTAMRPWMPSPDHPRRAALSSFGFGGSNFHCILEEHGGERPVDWDDSVQILAFCADRQHELKETLQSWPDELPWKELCSRAEESRQSFGADRACRLLIVLEREGPTAGKAISSARIMLEKHPEKERWSTPEGAFYGSGKKPGKLGILFPGQGSQHIGMLRHLACQFPEFLDTLAEAQLTFDEHRSSAIREHLIDLIYPRPAFDEESLKGQEAALRDTRVAQPALGAVSLGALRVMRHFGIKSDAYAGHSYGELVALAAAGRLTSADLHFLSAVRGNLMAGERGESGSMLAVLADVPAIEKIVQDHCLKVVLANKNAPQQTVLSGATEEIRRAQDAFTQAGIKNTLLPVSTAFHSPLVAEAQKPFAEALKRLDLKKGDALVFSNTTGSPYPDDAHEAREVIAGQLAKSVEFVREVTAMYEQGIRIFLEIGPGAKMAGLVKAILEERKDYDVLALDSSGGKRNGVTDLARALAQLASLACDCELSRWNPASELDRREREKPKPKMTVKLSGANYVKPSKRKAPSSNRIADAEKPGPQGMSRDSRMAPSPGNAPERRADPGHGHPKSGAVIAPGTLPGSPPSSGMGAQDPSGIAEALRLTQENMRALQNIQEQTARMHLQFLQNQDAALRTFQALAEQQQRLIQTHPGQGGSVVPPLPCYAYAPLSAPHQPLSPEPDLPAPPAIKGETSAYREPEAPAVPRKAAGADRLSSLLLSIVAEKTGYPTEMLELTMSLDSDLGIDSIKRVEIFSALKDALPELPAFKSEEMNTMKTLGDIVHFLSSAAPRESSVPLQTSPQKAPRAEGERVSSLLVGLVAEKTGYPAEMLELSMNLDSDLGIDSIKRVEIFSALRDALPDLPAFKSEEMNSMKTLEDITRHLIASVAGQESSDEPDEATQSGAMKEERISEIMVGLVAEKTGYPAEMLELSMNLDSDLGIDSIKRVEIFSALRDALPELPAFKPEEMNAMKTLGDIVAFISGRGAGLKTAAASELPTLPPPPGAPADSEVTGGVVEETPEINAALRRLVLSRQSLNGSSERERFTLAPGAEIWITDDRSPLVTRISERLAALKYYPVIITHDDLKTLKPPVSIGGLIIVAPEKAIDDEFLKKSFRLMQCAAPALKRAAATGASIFVTISRLDGAFGLEGLDSRSGAMSGGLAGLSKTAHHEWPAIHCKALDLSKDFTSFDKAADEIVEELFISGPLEVGLSPRGRSTIDLAQSRVESEAGTFPLQEGDILIVTGGARGVTAECVISLAEHFPPKARPALILLGRSAEPGEEPEWLAHLTDEADIKRELMQRAEQKATPAMVREKYGEIMAGREIRRTLARLASMGTEARYRSVDIRKKEELERAIAGIRSDFKGRAIRGLIHGAGVIADRLIEEKTADEFDYVYSTKVMGLLTMLSLLEKDDLRLLVFFSSTTGRFGRKGQVDYAVANEVLNKIARQQARIRPACRVLSLNWGPWDGGMVTPSLKKVFEKEGVGLIPLKHGAEFLVREICASGDNPVEVVVLGISPGHPEPRDDAGPLSVAFERILSIDDYGFLKSHVLDSSAVLPMAMIIEWMAHGAMQMSPGLIFCGFDDLRVVKGLKFHGFEKPLIQILTGKAARSGNDYSVPVELRSTLDGKSFHTNARALMRLSSAPPEGKSITAASPLAPFPHSIPQIYGDILFHGPAFQGIEQIEGWSERAITALARTAPRPPQWIKLPLRNSWIADPLALDCGFQMMILWSFAQYHTLSLPTYAGSYRQFRKFPKGPVKIVIDVRSHSSSKATATMEFFDGRGEHLISRLEGYECIIEPSLQRAFSKNLLDQEVAI